MIHNLFWYENWREILHLLSQNIHCPVTKYSGPQVKIKQVDQYFIEMVEESVVPFYTYFQIFKNKSNRKPYSLLGL